MPTVNIEPAVLAKPIFHHAVFLGDSIFDRGNLSKRITNDFLLFPLNGIIGYNKKSRRFTNEATVVDELIQSFLKRPIDLNNPATIIDMYGSEFESYAEGGATSHDYSTSLDGGVAKFFVGSLKTQRKKLFKEDKQAHISPQKIASTLVIELTGANDLITLHNTPSEPVATLAVKARIQNVIELMTHGYNNFYLITLPDLSLLPCFRKQTIETQLEAKTVTTFFNALLIKEVGKLKRTYPDCQIFVHDINPLFNEINQNPEKFGFDPAKIMTPLEDHPEDEQDPIKAARYPYYDDKHPTRAAHKLMQADISSGIESHFQFTVSADLILEVCKEQYRKVKNRRKQGCLGFFDQHFHQREYALDIDEMNVAGFLDEALYRNNPIAMDVIVRLGWVNDKKELITKHPDVVQSLNFVRQMHQDNKVMVAIPAA